MNLQQSNKNLKDSKSSNGQQLLLSLKMLIYLCLRKKEKKDWSKFVAQVGLLLLGMHVRIALRISLTTSILLVQE